MDTRIFLFLGWYQVRKNPSNTISSESNFLMLRGWELGESREGEQKKVEQEDRRENRERKWHE